jgi:hypothetical protein
MRFVRSSFFSLFAVTLLACGAGADGARGASGDLGPAGGVGPAGPPGASGPAETAGPTGTTGPAVTAGPSKAPRLLDTRVTGWKDDNRARLNKLLTDFGVAQPTFDPSHRPIAVFDWDNTILKNDIGDATFFWMLKHDKIRQPAGKDWSTTSAALTPAARSALNTACDGLAAAGTPLPTSTNAPCANEIVKIYDDETTAAGASAWGTVTTTKINNAYAWVAQLTQGWAPEDIRNFARAAYEENAYAPIGTTQTVGSLTGYTSWVRIYDPIADLIGALRDNGFDVWITTASPQFFVDAISQQTVNVPPSHVLGIRSMIVSGLVTTNLEGCGTIADAANMMITFDEGKRCWINKVIYSEPPDTQLPSNSDPTKRATFVAGDSDTDIAFLKDGAALRLVINRNKLQVMCNALRNNDGKWIWEPMFINPKARKTTPYPCSTGVDNGGTVGIVDGSGSLIPDQSEP